MVRSTDVQLQHCNEKGGGIEKINDLERTSRKTTQYRIFEQKMTERLKICFTKSDVLSEGSIGMLKKKAKSCVTTDSCVARLHSRLFFVHNPQI